MNYDKARQRRDGRWDYTTHNNRTGTYAIGYCRGEGDPPHHSDGHATADEACECYKQWLLDHCVCISDMAFQLPCAECSAPTVQRVLVGTRRTVILCTQHQGREFVAKRVRVDESWYS